MIEDNRRPSVLLAGDGANPSQASAEQDLTRTLDGGWRSYSRGPPCSCGAAERLSGLSRIERGKIEADWRPTLRGLKGSAITYGGYTAGWEYGNNAP